MSVPSKYSRGLWILVRTILLISLINIVPMGSSYALSVGNRLITDDPKAGTGCATPTPKTAFSPNDARVYSWVLVSDAFPLNTLTWKWLAPDNSLYATGQTSIGFTGSGCAWSWIDIKDQPAANKPGQWRTEIYLNNTFAAGDTFTLGTPQPPTCTYTFSAWGPCRPDGTQERTIVSSSPAGCIDWIPVLTQSCTYVPPTCTYTYSAWGPCQPDGTQTRTVVSSSPAGCTGTPVLSQTCSYVPPALSAPKNLRFILNGDLLTIEWDAVNGAAGYKAGLGTQAGKYSAPADLGNITKVGPVSVAGVPAGTYYIAVKAYKGNQEGAYSNEIVVTITTVTETAPNSGAAHLEFSINDQRITPWGNVHLSYLIKSFKPGLGADLYVALLTEDGGVSTPPNQVFSSNALALAKGLALSDTQAVILADKMPAQLSPLVVRLYGVLVPSGASPADPANWISNLAALDLALGPLSSMQTEVLIKQGNPQAYVVDFDQDKQRKLETWIYDKGDLGNTVQFMNGALLGTLQEGVRDCCTKGGTPAGKSPAGFPPSTTLQDIRNLLGDPDHVVKGPATGRETWIFDEEKLSVTHDNGVIRQIEVY